MVIGVLKHRALPILRAGAPNPRNRNLCGQPRTLDRSAYPRSITSDPTVLEDCCLPAKVMNEDTAYKLVVPISGIDPRHVYVLAAPHSVLVEIRTKCVIPHEMDGAAINENTQQRISREFTLTDEIEAGTAAVRISGDSLEITAIKSRSEHEPWSELIHFDTRGSLGYA